VQIKKTFNSIRPTEANFVSCAFYGFCYAFIIITAIIFTVIIYRFQDPDD